MDYGQPGYALVYHPCVVVESINDSVSVSVDLVSTTLVPLGSASWW